MTKELFQTQINEAKSYLSIQAQQIAKYMENIDRARYDAFNNQFDLMNQTLRQLEEIVLADDVEGVIVTGNPHQELIDQANQFNAQTFIDRHPAAQNDAIGPDNVNLQENNSETKGEEGKTNSQSNQHTSTPETVGFGQRIYNRFGELPQFNIFTFFTSMTSSSANQSAQPKDSTTKNEEESKLSSEDNSAQGNMVSSSSAAATVTTNTKTEDNTGKKAGGGCFGCSSSSTIDENAHQKPKDLPKTNDSTGKKDEATSEPVPAPAPAPAPDKQGDNEGNDANKHKVESEPVPVPAPAPAPDKQGDNEGNDANKHKVESEPVPAPAPAPAPTFAPSSAPTQVNNSFSGTFHTQYQVDQYGLPIAGRAPTSSPTKVIQYDSTTHDSSAVNLKFGGGHNDFGGDHGDGGFNA